VAAAAFSFLSTATPFALSLFALYANCCISAGGDNAWVITAEDRAKHNAQFEQLKPVNGFVTG